MREAQAAGLDVPLPDERPDNAGGFAYELIYLRLRIKPPDHLQGDEIDGFYERTLKPQEQRLRDILEPTWRDELAFNRAWNLMWEFEEYGLPHAGGYLDQPAEWRYVMNCARTAKQRADSYNHREEAAANKIKADQMPEATNPTSDSISTF